MNPLTSFLLQMALILLVARACSEICKRFNQPAVLGELTGGILLGPSLLGWISPDGFQAIFGQRAMLETMSAVGLILLMLLTGLESDVRVLRNMGRAAFASSAFGLILPFSAGLALGYALDDRFVPPVNGGRMTLALFLALAMAVSAMPVIAKILIDLKVIRRNFALVALSAAVVDDTIGWMILAMISGLVTSGHVNPWQALETLGFLVIFLTFARYILYPLLRRGLPRMEHEFRLPGGELTVILIVTLLCGALTEAMHVHAVFGAFVAGMILRQCPTLDASNLHLIESVTIGLFSPIFFAAVGLRVDLWQVQGLTLAAIVLLIAMAGKILGCLLGGVLSRMPVVEALAVGVCMSARGAIELVVAKLGLDLGILNAELFSIIVVMAVATSFMAPPLIRLLMPYLPPSEEERLREKGAAPSGALLPSPMRIVVPAGGGENALVGAHLATQLCRGEGDRVTALYIERAPVSWLKRLFSRRSAAGINMESYFQRLKSAAAPFADKFGIRRVNAEGQEVLDLIVAESSKACNMLVVGASGEKHPIYDPFISQLVTRAPCHVAVVAGPRSRRDSAVFPIVNPDALPRPVPAFQNILVPTNGSYYADAAFELAALYAQTTGARVTVLYVSEKKSQNPLLPAVGQVEVTEHMQDLMRVTLRQQFSERMKNPEKLECMVRENESVLTGLLEETRSGNYDLVMLGAENKSFVERLYLGQHIEAAITEVPCAIAIVIPKVGARR